MNSNSFFRPLTALCLAVTAQIATLQAQTSYTNYWWTNVAGGNWSVGGNWTNKFVTPPVSSPTNILNFTNVSASGYTATNDIGSAGTPFYLNQLKFGGGSVALTGNPLVFTNGTQQSWLSNYTASGAIAISNSITLGTNLYIAGPGTAGLTLYGPVLTNGTVYGLTKYGSFPLTLAGTNSIGAITLYSNTLTLAASSTNWIVGSLSVRGGTTGATMVINGPTVMTNGTVYVGNTSGDRALLVINTNLSIMNGEFHPGETAGSTGAVYQTGGRVSTIDGGGKNLYIGNNSFGYYRLTGGTLKTYELDVQRSASGNGYFDVLGGLCTYSSYFFIGYANGIVYNTVNVMGGIVDGTTGGNDFRFNKAANQTNFSVLNIGNGGAFTNNSGKVIDMMNSANALGSSYAMINLLSNGTLVAKQIYTTVGYTNSFLNFNGGTLQANIASTAFITNLHGAYIYGGGATIDNKTFAMTIGQPLLAPVGNGVTGVTIATAGAGYIAPPTVIFTNAGTTGSNATAIAQFDPASGTVTNILITNPGNGYDIAPTVAFFGGGGTNLATPGAVSIGVNSTSGGLTKLGTGALTLMGSPSTYGGNTTNSAGGLLLGADNMLGTGSLMMNGGFLGVFGGARTLTNAITLVTNGAFDTINSNLTLSGAITGPGALTKSNVNILTLNGPNSYSGNTTNITGVLMLGGTNALPYGKGNVYVVGGILDLAGQSPTINGLGGAGTVSNSSAASCVLTVGSGNATESFTGIIKDGGTDAVGVTKTGAGTQTLTGVSTYSGNTTITQGTLKPGAAAAIPNGAGKGILYVDGNGILDLNGQSITNNALLGSGIVTNSGATGKTLGLGTGDSNGVFAGMITDGSGNTIALVKLGLGTQVLSGLNAYRGVTTIGGGVLQIGNGGASGTIGTNTITDNAVLALNRTDSTYALNQVISGTGSLTNLAGTITLGGVNTYAGGTGIGAGGTLKLGIATAIPQGAGKGNVNVDGTLDLAGFSSTINGLYGSGIITNTGVSGDSFLTVGAASSNCVFAGTINDNGTNRIHLIKQAQGVGTVLLSGNSLFTGNVTNTATNAIIITSSGALGVGVKTVHLIPAVNSGIQPHLRLDGAGGNITLGTNINFTTSASGGALLSLDGDNVVGGNFSITGGGGDTLIAVTNGSLTLNGLVTNIYTGIRQFIISGPGSGIINGPIVASAQPTAVLKQDVGTWTINSTNTYIGSTLITGGTLILGAQASISNSALISVVSGSLFDVSQVTGGFALNTNQTLTGAGVVAGSVVVASNATVVPGGTDVAATLTITNGNLTFNAGSVLSVDVTAPTVVGGNTNDLLDINGDLTINGTLYVNVNFQSATQQAAAYPIIKYSGAWSGSISSLMNTQSFRGAVTFSNSTELKQIFVIFAGANSELTWKGDGVLNTWDTLVTSNWLNGATADTFHPADSVLFDNTGNNTVPINLAGTIRPSVVTVNAAKDYLFTGGTLAGGNSLVKLGTGLLTLTNNHTYVGGTFVNEGTLQIGMNGPGSLAGNITDNAKIIYANTNDNTTITNTISGSGTLVFSSSIKMGYRLAGTNPFTGAIYLTNNQVRLLPYTDFTNYGSASMIVVSNGGQLLMQGGSGAYPGSLNVPLYLAGIGGYDLFGAVRIEGVYGGPITLTGDAGIGNSTLNGTNNGTISGGAYQLSYLGAKVLCVNPGGNNQHGNLIINGPMVVAGLPGAVGNAGAFPSVPLTMTSGALGLNGVSFSFPSLSGVGGNINNSNTTTAATITIGSDNTSTIYSGSFTDGGTGSLPLSLVKIGTGMLTLNGASTFTGGAAINSGTVAAVSATALGNGLVTVATNATLRINSLVATYTNLLKVGSLTLNDGSIVSLSLNNITNVGSSDIIYVTNLLTLGVNQQVEFDFSFTKGAPVLGLPYTLITNLSGTTPGTPTGFTTKSSHYTAIFTNTGTRIQVTFGGGASNLVWTGDGGNNYWQAGVSNWFNGVTQDMFGGGDTVSFTESGTSNPVVTLTEAVLPTAVTINASGSYTFAGSGKISGTASLTKTGSGTLTLNTLNDYTGVTTVSNGILSIPSLPVGGVASPLGAPSGAAANLILAGGKLQYTGGSGTTDRGATLSAPSSFEVATAGVVLTNTGVVIGTIGNSLKKTGEGTLMLSGANTYVGDMIIDNGILKVGNASALGENVYGVTYITNTGTLDINHTAVNNETIIVSGSGYNGRGVIDDTVPTIGYVAAFTKNVVMIGDTTFGASLGRWDIRNAGAYLMCSNNLPYTLTKVGTNMMCVSAGGLVDTNLGNINILEGCWSVENAAGVGHPAYNLYVGSNANFRLYANSVALVKNMFMTNGIFEVQSGTANQFSGPIRLVSGSNAFCIWSGAYLTNSGPISGPGLLALTNGTGTLTLTGTNTYAGGTFIGSSSTMRGTVYSLQGNFTNQGTMIFDQPDAGTFGGFITGAGSVTKANTNVLTFPNPNQFTGVLSINAGWVSVAADNAVGAGTINFNGGGLTSSDVNARTVTNWFVLTSGSTWLGTSGTGDLLFNAPQVNNGAASKTLAISNSLTTINCSFTNTGPLTKTGPGVLAMGGNNNNSTLTVSSGTLALGMHAAFTNAATVIFASGATLDATTFGPGGYSIPANQSLYIGDQADSGANNMMGNLTNNGGKIYIADQGVGGILYLDSGLTLNGGTMQFDLYDPNSYGDYVNDIVGISGELNITAPSVIDVPAVMPDGTYTLMVGFTALNGSTDPGVVTALSVPPGLPGTHIFTNDGFGNLLLIVNGASAGTNLWTGDPTNTWDFATMNWLRDSSPIMFTTGDNVVFDDTATFANANNVDFGANLLKPSMIVVSNNTLPYTFIGTNGGGILSGPASLVKRGSGTLTIAATNDFYGSVRIEEGLVVLGNTISTLGSPLGHTNRSTVTITNGGTLDLNATVQDLPVFGGRTLVISGNGYDGKGAIINNGSQRNYNAVKNMTLAGNATVGANNRWDLRWDGVTLATLSTKSNAFNLSKVGTNGFTLVGVKVDPMLANVNIQEGYLQMETSTTSLGNPTNTLTVSPRAVLTMYNATNLLNKLIVVNSGGVVSNGSGACTIVGPVTLQAGTNPVTFGIGGTSLTMVGPLGGAGTLVKNTGSPLILATNNTWLGGMTISNGTVQIGTNGLYGSPSTGDITNYGTLIYNVAAANTWNNNIWGNGAFTVANGNLTLSNTTNIMGAVTVNGGTNGSRLVFNGPAFLANSNSITVGSVLGDRSTVILNTNFTTQSIANNNARMLIGNALGSAGAVIQNGGIVTINSTQGSADILSLGNNNGSGYYRMNGGQLITGQLGIGASAGGAGSAAVFEQFGGTVNVTAANGWLILCWNAGNDVLNIFNGTMTSPSGNDLLIGYTTANLSSFGMINLLGPNAVLNSTGNGTTRYVNLANYAGNRAGVLNLNAGQLIANRIFANSAGTPTFVNFSGGTLKAYSTGLLITNVTAATVFAGGAFIDSDTNSAIIPQPLTVPTGSGVSSVAILNNGVGYIGAPVVQITGGSGSNATAIAQVDLGVGSLTAGQITNILVTSPGMGYVGGETLTASLIGGGATTAATLGTVTLSANVGGGLTKLGLGTLTLTATNTFSGATTVSNGTLVINGQNIGGGNTVVQGGTLVVNGTNATGGSAIIVNAAGTLAGAGTNNAPVTINGTLSAGSVGTSGTLTLGQTTFNTGSTNFVDLSTSTNVGGGVNDLLVVNGNLTVQPGVNVNLNFFSTPVLNQPYTIITYTGDLIGDVANNFSVPGTIANNPHLKAVFANVPGSPNAITVTIATTNAGGNNLVWQGDGVTNQWNGAGITNQWINSAGWTAFWTGDNVLFDDTTTNFSITLSNSLLPVSVIVNATNNYAFTGSGNITGAVSLTKLGSGLLTLGTTNKYTGGTLISNGVIKVMTNTTVLGLPVGTTPLCVITNAGGVGGAALDLNLVDLNAITAYTNPIVISGRSTPTAGAIYTSGAALAVGKGIKNLVLAGHAAIGNNGNRFDVNGYVNGGGYNLTTLPGSGQIIGFSTTSPVTNLNSITAAGAGTTEFGSGLTQLGGTIVTNLLKVNLYRPGGYGTAYGGIVSNSMMYMSNATFSISDNNGVWGGAIVFFPGTTNTFDDGGKTGFGVFGPISGAASLKKQGSQSLYLTNVNTYSGSTLVTVGKLILGTNASIANTPLISLSSGTTLDVSAVAGGFTLNGAVPQTLAGSGVVTGSVTVANNAGLTVGPVGGAGTLSFSNNLTFNGQNFLNFEVTNSIIVGGNSNDLVVVSNNLTLPASGTITVNFGFLDVPTLGQAYTIMTYGGTLSGDPTNAFVTGIGSERYNVAYGKVDGTPGRITATFTTNPGGVGSLVWRGDGVTNVWNTTYTNQWTNNTGWAAFQTGDSVILDDTSSNQIVNLGGTVRPRTITMTTTSNYLFAGAGLAGPGVLLKSGISTLTITNAQTYYGGTYNGVGSTLVAGSTNVTYASYFGTGPITNNGTLWMLGINATGNPVNDLYGDGPIYMTNTTTADQWSPVWSGNLSSFTGTIYLTGVPDSRGTRWNSSSSGGSAMTINVADRSQIYVFGTNTYNMNLVLGGGTGTDQPGSIRYQNCVKLAGNITLTTNTIVNTYSTANIATNAGVITGPWELSQQGGGVIWYAPPAGSTNSIASLKLNGITNYCGGSGAISAGTTLNMANSSSVFYLYGNDITVAELFGTVGSVQNGASTPARLVVGDASTNLYGGTLMDGGVGALGLTKIGTGTLFLTNANNAFNGATVVSNGLLALNGISGNGTVTVKSGATLAGTGKIGGATTVESGGTLMPGTNARQAVTLVISNGLTLNGATISFDLGTSNDLIAVAGGTLTLSGVNLIQPNIIGTLTNGTYVLMTNASPVIGDASNLATTPALSNICRSLVFDTTSQPGSVLMIVSGTGSSLVWQGDKSSDWDYKLTKNWTNGTGAEDFFISADVVLFDDSAINRNVNLVGSLNPASMTVSNTVGYDYTWGGSGTITGAVSLAKQGTGTLTLSNSMAYSGSTLVQNGLVQLGALDALPVNGSLYLGVSNMPTVGALSLVTASQTVGALISQSTNALATNAITIAGGQTLTVNGNLLVGANISGSKTMLSVSGPGSLVVNKPAAIVNVSYYPGRPNNNWNRAVLDLSALANFSFMQGSALNVGAGDNSVLSASVITLATNNTLLVTNINVGADGGAVQSLLLGSGTNLIYADVINIGNNTGTRDSGTFIFNTTNGNVAITNTTGTGRATLNIGISTSATGYGATNAFEVSGHLANLYLGTLTIGNMATRVGYQTNYFGFDQGTLDVTNILMAQGVKAGTGNESIVSFGGGVVNVGVNGINVASNGNGTLKITGGLVNVFGDITGSTDSGSTSTVRLDGGTLDLFPAGDLHGPGQIGYTTNPISTLVLMSGTLRNLAEYNGSAANNFVKSGLGLLKLEGTNTYTGLTYVNGGILQVDGVVSNQTDFIINSSGTLLVNGKIGTGNNQVTVYGKLGGTGTINAFASTINSSATLAPGLDAAVGTLTNNGSVTLAPASFTIMKLDKVSPQSNDVLVANSIALNGTLTVTNLGVAPQAGDVFKLFHATLTGGFTSYVLPTLPVGLGWDASQVPVNGTLVVVPQPVITQDPQPAYVITGVGSNVTFTAAATGANLYYQWFFNMTIPITGATSTQLNLVNLQATNTGVYSLHVTNLGGAVMSATATLVVTNHSSAPLGLVITPSPTNTVDMGNKAEFTATVTGGSVPIEFYWYKLPNVTVPVGLGNNYTSAVVTCASEGDAYHVVASNSVGTVTSTVAYVEVRDTNAPAFNPAVVATNVTLLQGTNFSVTVGLAANCNLATYRWYVNATNLLASQTTPTLSLANLKLNDGGIYTLIVSNQHGLSAIGTAAVVAVSYLIESPMVIVAGETFQTTVVAEPNRAYWLEARNSLTEGTWTFVLGVTNVTGPQVLQDAAATGGFKFYRIGSAPTP